MFLTKKMNDRIKIILLFVAAFVLWFFPLRDLFSGKPTLFSDAVPYYDNIKFFIESLSQGRYPFWLNYHVYGVSNEFFLRRIGDFNPAYGLVLLFYKLGVGFNNIYSGFLITYYFLGMIGFYKLSGKLFKNQALAYISFLLLTFSCFSSLIFKSFILLVFVPGIWFFYFLFEFFSEPRKGPFLGMTFCLMIILTTYIPFYFFIIFMLFVVFSCIFYPVRSKAFIVEMYAFIKNNKIFMAFCSALILISFLPGLMFFLRLRSAELILPVRQYLSDSANSFSIAQQSTVLGGIPSSDILGSILGSYGQLSLGDFYLPIFIYVFLLLGAFVKLNKRLCFLFLFGFFMFLIGIYDASPVYGFLYKYVFIFKYFRNFQFFLWLVIIPALILLCTEHLRSFLEDVPVLSKEGRHVKFMKILMVHLLLILFLLFRKEAGLFPYASVILSIMLFYFFLYEQGRKRKFVFLSFCLFAVSYATFFLNMKISREAKNIAVENNFRSEIKNISEASASSYTKDKAGLADDVKKVQYLMPRSFYFLTHNVEYFLLNEYVKEKFVVYDKVLEVSDPVSGVRSFEESLKNKQDLAFIASGKNGDEVVLNDSIDKAPFYSQGNDDKIQMIENDDDRTVIKTDFDKEKFLVFNDNYSDQWHAFVNGKEVGLFRANFSFKGIFLHKGSNLVEFRCGASSDYFYKFFIMSIFYLSFLYLLYLLISEYHEKSKARE